MHYIALLVTDCAREVNCYRQWLPVPRRTGQLRLVRALLLFLVLLGRRLQQRVICLHAFWLHIVVAGAQRSKVLDVEAQLCEDLVGIGRRCRTIWLVSSRLLASGFDQT